jgi:hypothetical protein
VSRIKSAISKRPARLSPLSLCRPQKTICGRRAQAQPGYGLSNRLRHD